MDLANKCSKRFAEPTQKTLASLPMNTPAEAPFVLVIWQEGNSKGVSMIPRRFTFLTYPRDFRTVLGKPEQREAMRLKTSAREELERRRAEEKRTLPP